MTQSLAQRLQIRPKSRGAVINAPSGMLELYDPLPEGVTLSMELSDGLDFVHLFVRNRAELEQFGPAVLAAAQGDKLWWVSYPKRSAKLETDITRDAGWGLVDAAGLRGVRQISIDEVWSALRFRPREAVGK